MRFRNYYITILTSELDPGAVNVHKYSSETEGA